MAVTDATVRKASNVAPERPSADQLGVAALMHEFFQVKPGDGGETRDSPKLSTNTQPTSPRRDFDTATELLDRASRAFDLLINRCQILEHDLNDTNERAQVRADEQDETIEKWKQLAGKLKVQLEITEQAMASLRTRCDAVEDRAVKAEKQVKSLEAASVRAVEYATMAEQLSTKLHDKVVAAFGIGSRAHPVLEAVATQDAAE